jgi:hypothetical protein
VEGVEGVEGLQMYKGDFLSLGSVDALIEKQFTK